MTGGGKRDATAPTLITLSLPLPWDAFGLPNPLATRSTVLVTGEPGWAWRGGTPDLDVPLVDPASGTGLAGWDLDHVVLLVPDLEELVASLATVGLEPRLRMLVRDRPAAFFRVGPVLEVIESPVRSAALYGVALVTEEPLETVTLRWRSMGIDVGDVRPAIQPGRRIFSVRSIEAGLAVMSPDRAR